MKPEERRALAAVPAYEKSTATELYQVYGRYSQEKVEAFEYCKNLCREYEDWGLRIIRASSWIFTAGFQFTNKETGEVMFMYITPTYDTPVSYPC